MNSLNLESKSQIKFLFFSFGRGGGGCYLGKAGVSEFFYYESNFKIFFFFWGGGGVGGELLGKAGVCDFFLL